MNRRIALAIKMLVMVAVGLLPLMCLPIRNAYGALRINSVTANPIEARVGQEVFVETSVTLAC
jgi:hypothetical protein